jgi:hypothetical protein
MYRLPDYLSSFSSQNCPFERQEKLVARGFLPLYYQKNIEIGYNFYKTSKFPHYTPADSCHDKVS